MLSTIMLNFTDLWKHTLFIVANFIHETSDTLEQFEHDSWCYLTFLILIIKFEHKTTNCKLWVMRNFHMEISDIYFIANIEHEITNSQTRPWNFFLTHGNIWKFYCVLLRHEFTSCKTCTWILPNYQIRAWISLHSWRFVITFLALVANFENTVLNYLFWTWKFSNSCAHLLILTQIPIHQRHET